MKRNTRGFVVFDSKQEEVAWAREWIKDHPSPLWRQCENCRSFHLSKTKPRPGSQCAQCRGQSKAEDEALMPLRKPGFRSDYDVRRFRT